MTSVLPAAAQTVVRADGRERIHLGDVIDVDVVGSFEFDWRGGLTPEGFLDGFDKIADQVFALCRTEESLAAEIREKYSRILREPDVRVRIVDKTQRPAALVVGAVGKPQRYSINREVRLSELIILSGGITDTSSGEITIFRPPGTSCISVGEAATSASSGNSPQTINIKITDILSGDASANPIISGGDVVSVLRAFPIYVTGGVNNPSTLTFRPGLSVSRAIAMAGGLSKGAISADVTLFRKGKTGVEVVKVDLSAINAGRGDDIELGPYDVVEVGLKGRAPRTQPPVIETPGLNDENTARLPLYIVD